MANRKRRENETYKQYKSHLKLEQKATDFCLMPRAYGWINDYWKVVNNKRINFLTKRLFCNWGE